MKRIILLSLLLLPGITLADGKELLKALCMECHVVDGVGGEKAAAPPMYAVWHHYRQEYPERESFVAAMSGWLMQPDREGSLMQGAIQKFGLMEAPEISEAEAQTVAAYIYDIPFELPQWYLQHYNKSHDSRAYGYSGSEKATQQLEQ